jgi:hypothetical protein
MDAIKIGTFAYAVAGLFVYISYGVIWRLWYSPVAKFPGSKLAAVTFWYEFYYDVIKGGAYVYEIERMHAKYGRRFSLFQMSKATSIDEDATQGLSSASTHTNCTSMTRTWNSCPNCIPPSVEM